MSANSYDALLESLLREALEVLPARGNLRRRITQALESPRGPESDGGITQALVEMARANAIEECARSLEPANHPLLMAAVKTIRALSSSATNETG